MWSTCWHSCFNPPKKPTFPGHLAYRAIALDGLPCSQVTPPRKGSCLLAFHQSSSTSIQVHRSPSHTLTSSDARSLERDLPSYKVTPAGSCSPVGRTTASMADSTSTSNWGTASYPPSPGTAHDGDNDAEAYGTGPSSTAASSVFLPDSGRARPRRKRDLRRFATQCATVDDPASDMHDQHNASSVPIYMTATFKGTAGAGRYDCKYPIRPHARHTRLITGNARFMHRYSFG